jgi:hypothetical protein
MPPFGLPLLRQALDRRVMQPKLAALLARGARIDSARLAGCKRGRRALVEYRIVLPEGRRLCLLAKHFAEPAHAYRVHDIACQLRLHASRRGFSTPHLLGWVPDLSLVVYVPVRGRAFGEVAFGADGDRCVRRVASAIASLHGSKLSLDRSFDLECELRNLAAWAELVAAEQPESAASAGALARDLRRTGAQLVLSLRTPVHKDFHYQHVLVRRRKVTLLDFDEVRLGDPSFDLAHFCAYLELLGFRSRALAAADACVRSFLEGYTRETGWTRDERFDYFTGYTWLKIAKQLATGSGATPRPSGRERRRQLAYALERGGACARGS